MEKFSKQKLFFPRLNGNMENVSDLFDYLLNPFW